MGRHHAIDLIHPEFDWLSQLWLAISVISTYRVYCIILMK
jgi:hypothetical protein